MGENREETLKLAETLDGETVKFYKDLAKNNQMWLSFGGIHEVDLDEVSDIFLSQERSEK